MTARDAHRSEATAYARYLVGAAPSEAVIERWVGHVARIDPAPSPRDQALIDLAIRRPALLGVLDGGLALRRPEASLRRRLLLMAAILETTPEHADRFLPAADGRAPWLRTVAAGLRAGLRGAIGVVVVSLR